MKALQGFIKLGALGFAGADLTRLTVFCVAAIGVAIFDRRAWQAGELYKITEESDSPYRDNTEDENS